MENPSTIRGFDTGSQQSVSFCVFEIHFIETWRSPKSHLCLILPGILENLSNTNKCDILSANLKIRWKVFCFWVKYFSSHLSFLSPGILKMMWCKLVPAVKQVSLVGVRYFLDGICFIVEFCVNNLLYTSFYPLLFYSFRVGNQFAEKRKERKRRAKKNHKSCFGVYYVLPY